MAEGDMKKITKAFFKFGGVKVEKLNVHNSKEMINLISADIEKLIVSGGFTYG